MVKGKGGLIKKTAKICVEDLVTKKIGEDNC